MTDDQPGGEVAIREHGGVTAVEIDSLEETVSVNLDHDPPLVGVPEEVGVLYEDGESGEEAETATDGGIQVRDAVRVRQYGLGLEGEQRNLVTAIMAAAFAAAGYLWHSSQLAAFVTFCAAGVLTYLLFYWGASRGEEAAA